MPPQVTTKKRTGGGSFLFISAGHMTRCAAWAQFDCLKRSDDR
jgi:hypothetical protein